MRKFVVYYTLEDGINKEVMIKEDNVNKEDVVREIFEKVKAHNFFIAKNDDGSSLVNASLIRYIRVLEKRQFH